MNSFTGFVLQQVSEAVNILTTVVINKNFFYYLCINDVGRTFVYDYAILNSFDICTTICIQISICLYLFHPLIHSIIAKTKFCLELFVMTIIIGPNTFIIDFCDNCIINSANFWLILWFIIWEELRHCIFISCIDYKLLQKLIGNNFLNV